MKALKPAHSHFNGLFDTSYQVEDNMGKQTSDIDPHSRQRAENGRKGSGSVNLGYFTTQLYRICSLLIVIPF